MESANFEEQLKNYQGGGCCDVISVVTEFMVSTSLLKNYQGGGCCR
jgi:hypothetical protein